MKTKSILNIPTFDLVKPTDFVTIKRDGDDHPTLAKKIAENVKSDRPWPHRFSHAGIDWKKQEHLHLREYLAVYNEYYDRIKRESRVNEFENRVSMRDFQEFLDILSISRTAEELRVRLEVLLKRQKDLKRKNHFVREELVQKNLELYEQIFREAIRLNTNLSFMELQHLVQRNEGLAKIFKKS